MTTHGSPVAALDSVLGQARQLLLDFDGVICRLYQPGGRERAAERLRATLSAEGAREPRSIPGVLDPITILAAYSGAVSHGLARRAEAELADLELEAVPAAQPCGYVQDVIASARESGRVVAVVSDCSARAVEAYLDRAGPGSLAGLTAARAAGDAESARPGLLLARCLALLAATPATCALVSARAIFLDAATAAGMATVTYRRGSDAAGVPSVRSRVDVSSLSDVVLWLRARPVRDNIADHSQSHARREAHRTAFNLGRNSVAQSYMPTARGVESPTLMIRNAGDGGGLYPVFEQTYDALAKRSSYL